MEFSGIRFEFWCLIAHVLFKMLVFFDDFLHTTSSTLHQLKSVEEISKKRVAAFGRYVHGVKVLNEVSKLIYLSSTCFIINYIKMLPQSYDFIFISTRDFR